MTEQEKVSFTPEQVQQIKKERIQWYKKDMDLFRAWRDYQICLAEIAKAELEEFTSRYQLSVLKEKMSEKMSNDQKSEENGDTSTE